MAALARLEDVPEALKRPIDADERAEIERFIHVLDYEKHSGAEHRAVEYLRRLYGRVLALEARACPCGVDDGLVQEWVAKARAFAESEGYTVVLVPRNERHPLAYARRKVAGHA